MNFQTAWMLCCGSACAFFGKDSVDQIAGAIFCAAGFICWSLYRLERRQ